MQGFSVGLVLGAVIGLCTALFCALLCYKAVEPIIKAMRAVAEEPKKTRHEHKEETTEEKYVGTLYRYLRYGAHLNHARLGLRNKIEISKPELVGGPDNAATKISVMWGIRNGELRSVLDVFVDGDWVEVEPKGMRLPHPIPQQAKYNDGELNRLGFILADFAQHYFED
jgi:hypothetical protein